jgi:hypothetical protein
VHIHTVKSNGDFKLSFVAHSSGDSKTIVCFKCYIIQQNLHTLFISFRMELIIITYMMTNVNMFLFQYFLFQARTGLLRLRANHNCISESGAMAIGNALGSCLEVICRICIWRSYVVFFSLKGF